MSDTHSGRRSRSIARRLIVGLLAAIPAFPQPALSDTDQRLFSVVTMLQSVARVEVLSNVNSVFLSPEQAQERRLVVPGAVLIELLTSRGGYGLDLDILDPLVASVEIDGLGRKVVVGPGGHHEWFPTIKRRATIRLTYVVTYLEGVTAGQRPAPLSVRFDLS